MASFNKVIMIGNLVADPELKQTPNGVSVTSFRIAVSRRFTRAGEQPQSDFFDVVAWRQTAEFVTRFFTKGRSILVSGSLQTRSWTDQNGAKRISYEIVADECAFVDRRPDGSGSREMPANEVPAYSSPKMDGSFEELSADDELPF
ncbi:MAG: single-stranded DNA-binding protein [Clostridia bacterium]|nr:single-stranded DNA-binding protein [Clostridia bacterium]